MIHNLDKSASEKFPSRRPRKPNTRRAALLVELISLCLMLFLVPRELERQKNYPLNTSRRIIVMDRLKTVSCVEYLDPRIVELKRLNRGT